jgi:sortase (surface protein transpeptidase)
MRTNGANGTWRRSPFVLGGLCTVVALVTAGLLVGAPNSVAVAVRRVEATPSPSPSPVILETPRPAPIETPLPQPKVVPQPLSTSCPQLDNPGGGVSWYPSADAGPWPTDGNVSIPTIGTNAPIVRVGVDLENQMVVPPDARQIAWLDQGGIPGQTNNIVLAGHVTWAGVPGAFHRIGDLLPGDMIVLSIEGRRMVFRTTWVCEFPRTSSLAPRIMGYTEVPSVTLITCGGAWDAGAGTHADRIVARGVLVY